AWRTIMHESGGKTYRPWEPERYRHEAQSPAGKLPEGDLVFFLLDTVPRLDLQRFYAPYEKETRGAPPFDPAMMVCLLLYAYCVGVFSSRKIALACERNLAFMAIVGQERPDFRTISDFRKQHLEVFKEVFVQVVRVAVEAERQRTGKPRRGKAPQPVADTPDDKAQMSFTDPELHIMRTNNKGWDYCGNAQASVDGTCQIIVACDVTEAPNDKQQAAPLA